MSERNVSGAGRGRNRGSSGEEGPSGGDNRMGKRGGAGSGARTGGKKAAGGGVCGATSDRRRAHVPPQRIRPGRHMSASAALCSADGYESSLRL